MYPANTTDTQAAARETARRLRAIHAAARPCGSAEDGRPVFAIHADAPRLTDLTHAADHIEALAALVADLEQALRYEADLAQQAIDALPPQEAA